MLLTGSFEGLDRPRGIAWRCADSLALRAFLGFAITEATAVQASLPGIRKRLPASVIDEVFGFALNLLAQQGVLRGKRVAIAATALEANAAMKRLVRKATGADWKQSLQGLAPAEGLENPTAEALRRLARGREEKKVSNEQWESPSDPASRIAKMKDGRTPLASKAEQAVDLGREALVATTVTFADQSAPQSAPVTLRLAAANLALAGSAAEMEEVVLDKGYHDHRLRVRLAKQSGRTYSPERRQKSRGWTDKPAV
jgi:transposase